MKILFSKKYLLLAVSFIAILAFFIRVPFLDRVPPGILNDEYKYVMNARAVWFTGSGVYGNWNPLSLKAEPKDVKDSELLPLVLSPVEGIVPFTLFWVKLPFALLGVADVLMLAILGFFLFDSFTGVIIGLLAAINPYLIMFSRSGYDAHVAMFFFLAGMLLLFVLKRWKILFAFFPFALSFYSYVGLKVSFLPLVAGVLFWFAWFRNRKDWKMYVALFLLCAGVVGIFLLQLKTSPAGARIQELIFPSSPEIATTVIQERTQSISPRITSLFVNKYTVWVHHVVGDYLDAFSLRTLFIAGENSTHQSLFYLGYFYIFDLIFMIFGAVFLWMKKRNAFVFFAIVILLSPLTGAFRTDPIGSHVVHAVIMFPLLVMLAGFGIVSVYSVVFKKNRLFGLALCVIYLLSFANFLQLYLIQMPFFNAKGLDLSSRILANYVIREKPKQKITVVAKEPRSLFKLYLLYASEYNSRQDVEKVKDILTKGDISHSYAIDGITFVQADPHKVIPQTGAVIVEAGIPLPESEFFTIKQPYIVPILIDGGAVFKIFHGQTCSGLTLHGYPQGITFRDLSLEHLSEQVFCKAFIIQYR